MFHVNSFLKYDSNVNYRAISYLQPEFIKPIIDEVHHARYDARVGVRPIDAFEEDATQRFFQMILLTMQTLTHVTDGANCQQHD
jgi:hypothetical protein